MKYYSEYCSPLGKLLLAGDAQALKGLWFENQDHIAKENLLDAEKKPISFFAETERWLDLYFSGKNPDFTPLLRYEVTPFRRMIYEILLTIPYGTTVTYGEIAKAVSRIRNVPKMSAQAVGGAVGHNPIALIIPCHRVVGANGNLTGYAGGIEKKLSLLELEKADMREVFIPKNPR